MLRQLHVSVVLLRRTSRKLVKELKCVQKPSYDILRINSDKTLDKFTPEQALLLWLDDGPTHIDHDKLQEILDKNQMNSTEATLSLAGEEE